jgi:NADH-quinone oxidoreductase subunit N
MPNIAELTWQLLLVISVASMTVGNVCALWQNNMRRLMAFSSIAHAGYFLIGIVVAVGGDSRADGNGVGAATFYVIVYSLASLGVFAALAYLGGIEREVDGVDDLAGLGKTQPLAAASMTICLVSLAGIPPLAGFWGKLTLFSGAIQAASAAESGVWFVVLASLGAINAAIAVAYYLRVVAAMYFAAPKREFGCEGGWGAQAAMVAAALMVLGIGFLPGGVMNATRRAEQSVQRPPATALPQATAATFTSTLSDVSASADPRIAANSQVR